MKPRLRLVAAVFLAGLPAAGSAGIDVLTSADGALVLTNLLHDPAPTQPAAAPAAPLGAALPFAEIVAAAAVEYDLPEALLHAVIHVESNHDPAAVSPRGALGLMQLMPATARELGVGDALDPEVNVRAGARYLRRLLTLFGDDLALALAAYNAGPGAVLRHDRGVPPFSETRRYVPRVLAHFHRLQASFEARGALAVR